MIGCNVANWNVVIVTTNLATSILPLTLYNMEMLSWLHVSYNVYNYSEMLSWLQVYSNVYTCSYREMFKLTLYNV